jgi:hypothetical protein
MRFIACPGPLRVSVGKTLLSIISTLKALLILHGASLTAFPRAAPAVLPIASLAVLPVLLLLLALPVVSSIEPEYTLPAITAHLVPPISTPNIMFSNYHSHLLAVLFYWHFIGTFLLSQAFQAAYA